MNNFKQNAKGFIFWCYTYVFLNEGHLDWIENHAHEHTCTWYVSVMYTLGIQSAGL